MKKEKFITEKYLDKRFEQHSQVIIAAVDGILEKRLGKMEERLEKKINNVQILIDGYVKAQEDFKQEFVIMKHENGKIKKALLQELSLLTTGMPAIYANSVF